MEDEEIDNCFFSLHYICSMRPLPEAFTDRIRKQFPNDHSVFLESLEFPVRTSIHVHPIKGKDLFAEEKSVPWWPGGRMLGERPKFTYDPLFHAGAYYPQESSSMFIGFLAGQILKNRSDVRVLDLCASPGGKSILLSEVIAERGVLISNEVNRSRAKILQENLVKWGASNVVVTSAEASHFSALKGYFDLVLVDAPCSGEGMFRKDERAREEWSEANVRMCAARQKDILRYIPDLLKPDGHLIYSTCTFAPEENEYQTDFLVNEYGLQEARPVLPEAWNEAITLDGGFKFLPHKAEGEGFYCNVFRKPPGSALFSLPGKTSSSGWYRRLTTKEFTLFTGWNLSGAVLNKQMTVYDLPMSLEELEYLQRFVFIIMPGVEIGELIRDTLIPAHALSMQPNIHSVFPEIEISRQDAIAYLSKEEIKIEAPTQGWALVSYLGRSLGFVKVLRNRVNNYYPRDWKIRYRES